MSKEEDALLKGFSQLPAAQQETVLEFVTFLVQRYAIEAEPIPEKPLDIPRPQKESVVKAVKRLSKTYPMLDTKELFEKTSSFMMRNLMHGEESVAVIDEMEAFFEKRYQVLFKEKTGD